VASLYADEDISPRVVRDLRTLNHDVWTTVERGRATATDGDQWLYASHHRRILLTHNKKDFLLLRDAWQRWAPARGVVLRHASILALDRWLVQGLAPIVDDFLRATPGLADGGHLFRWNSGNGHWDPLP
jgi:predicted nuclease of predicted toxin-antitoxin system